MWITLLVVYCGFYLELSEAQTTVSITATVDDEVTLPCTLTGSFTLPAWLGPPNLLSYTNQDDGSETINPLAPAVNRLQYNTTNKKDLILSQAQISDTGVYKCSYTGRGDHTVTLTVKAKECTCDCKCKKKCTRIVIPSIVFGCLGVINLPIVSGGAVSGFLGRTTALVVDSIGIVCDVISLVLGIVVQVEDCCEDAADCCEDDSDCCEDSNCCKDECERNWVENTGAAFIAIGVLVGILAGFIFHRVWSNRMGPGNNAYKAKEAKHPDENHGMTGTSM